MLVQSLFMFTSLSTLIKLSQRQFGYPLFAMHCLTRFNLAQVFVLQQLLLPGSVCLFTRLLLAYLQQTHTCFSTCQMMMNGQTRQFCLYTTHYYEQSLDRKNSSTCRLRVICLDCRMCLRRAKSHTLHNWQFITMDCKIKTCSSEVFDRLLCFHHNLSNSHLGVFGPFTCGSMLSVMFVRADWAINLANLRRVFSRQEGHLRERM